MGCDGVFLGVDPDMIALTGFHVLLHLGEMTQPNTMLKCSSKKLSWRHTLQLHTNHFTYLLPFHKGDRFFNGNTVLVMLCPLMCTCPLAMMCHYLRLRDTKFSLLPNCGLHQMAVSQPTHGLSLGYIQS